MAPPPRGAVGAAVGGDDALRAHQNSQLCKQLAALATQLANEVGRSELLLESVYALGDFATSPACCLEQIAATYPEFAAKLQRAVRPHPLREMHVEQTEGDAVDAVVASADALSIALAPMYGELQEVGKHMVRAAGLLADLHQLLITVTMATAPQLIDAFMTLVTNLGRTVLLMQRVPWTLIVQVYTIVTMALQGTSPPGRAAVVELLERLEAPVPFLQELLQPVAPRVSQILELTLGGVLEHLCSARVLAASSVFDITRLGVPGAPRLGVAGLSLDRTYALLVRAEQLRDWALLGLLACPSAATGVGGPGLVSALMRESLLLHVHGAVCTPLHALFQAYMQPVLDAAAATADSVGGGGGGAGVGGGSTGTGNSAALRLLVSRCHSDAAQGAAAEHAARRRLAACALQDMLSWLQDDASQLPDALPMALAAQAYAKAELLWYFRHVGEMLPAGPAGQQLNGPLPASGGSSMTGSSGAAGAIPGEGSGPRSSRVVQQLQSSSAAAAVRVGGGGSGGTSGRLVTSLTLLGGGAAGSGSGSPLLPLVPQDSHVVTLLSATAAMTDLLETHAEALQAHQLATLRALLEQQVLPETAAVLDAAAPDDAAQPTQRGGVRERTVPRVLLPLVQGIVYPLAELAQAIDCAALLNNGPAAHSSSCTPAELQEQQSAAAAAAAAAASGSGGCNSSSRGGAVGRAAAATLADARACMLQLGILLGSRNLWMRPAVLEAPAQDPQYLQALHKLLELAPAATCLTAALEPACCLDELVHRQAKLLDLAQHVLDGTTLAHLEALPAVPAMIKARETVCDLMLAVLRWFEHSVPAAGADGLQPRDYSAEAKMLAARLMEEACGTVALLLAGMAQELNQQGLYVTHMHQQQTQHQQKQQQQQQQQQQRALTWIPGRGDAAAAAAAVGAANSTTTAPVADTGGGAPASLRARALTLSRALDALGPVRVSSDRLLVPAEYLRAALQQCMLVTLSDLLAEDEVPPVSSALERRLGDLLFAGAQLQQGLCVDVRPELWQVMLSHAQPDWVLPPADSDGLPPSRAPCAMRHAPPGTDAGSMTVPVMVASTAGGGGGGVSNSTPAGLWRGAGGRLGGSFGGGGAAGRGQMPAAPVRSAVAVYADWASSVLVRDARGWGVMFAPQLRSFTAVVGVGRAQVEARASLPELTALLRMFGPYAALRLAEATEAAVLDCLAALDGCLGRWQDVLDDVSAAVVRDDVCADAVAAARRSLSDEAQALSAARMLSRALALRQLLGEALNAALGAALPIVSATLDAVPGNVGLAVPQPPLRTTGRGMEAPERWLGRSSVLGDRHVCDVFGLPRPGLQGDASPVVADPLLVDALVGGNTIDRYRSWLNLPALLGLCLASPGLGGAAPPNPASRASPGELHALGHAAKCLALAQAAAADRVLTRGSSFLRPGQTGEPVAAALTAFTRVAAAALLGSGELGAARGAKTLLLDSLTCPLLPAAVLADAWLPPTRVRSARCQAAV